MSAFEVKRRDGLARIGEYTDGSNRLSLPAAVVTDLLFPRLGDHPFSNVPLFAPEEFVREYLEPSGPPVAVHPLSEAPVSSGSCVMVANWHTTLENPRAYVRWLTALKGRLPPDTAFYAPAAAIPSNAALLIYTGFDLFDFRAVDLQAAQGIFCTSEGGIAAGEAWDAGLCGCEGCRDRDLRAHNRAALLHEIALVRHFIAKGQLREYLEGRCRVQAAQVAILRLLDEQYSLLERTLPIVRSVQMKANSSESLKRPEVKRFAGRVVERYVPPRTDVAVLLPCSAKKPYSLSQSHARFQAAILGRAHELIITSPLGLVPREIERIYPAAHYDVPVTGYWDREERAFVTDVLRRYFERHPYRRVIAHLEGDTLDIVREVADSCGWPLEVTCGDHPTSQASLAALAEALQGERKMRPDIIKGTLAWQFGRTIDTHGLLLKGRSPRQKVIKGRTQLFSLDAETGLLRPTFEGWELIGEGYRVRIDDFIPQGDVLAPGVIGADPEIREGDEVLVIGPRALATGRASMGADEMIASGRGVAVRVRKVKILQP